MRLEERQEGGFRTPIAVALGLTALALSAAAQDFETPPVLRAQDLVDEELLSGPHHVVDEEVANDGRMNHFFLRSDFGDFVAESEPMLGVRVQEMYAIAELQEISRTKAFADAIRSAAIQPVKAVGQVATHPVNTVKGLPSGINRKFRGLAYKGRKATQRVKEEVKQDDDEAQGEDENVEEGSSKASTTDQVTGAAKSVVGYDSARRDLARRLQVDPYSTNQVLQQELTRLAQAAFAGGLSFRAVTPPTTVLNVAGDINDLVWTLSPTELERRNNLALTEMGVEKALRLEFFANKAYTPTLETVIVQALGGLAEAHNRSLFVEIANRAETVRDARFFVGGVRILEAYDDRVAPITEIVLAGNEEFGSLIVGLTSTGQVRSCTTPATIDLGSKTRVDAASRPSRRLRGEHLTYVLGLQESVGPRSRRFCRGRPWRCRAPARRARCRRRAGPRRERSHRPFPVVPGLPKRWVTPSSFSRVKKADRPLMEIIFGRRDQSLRLFDTEGIC